MVNGRVSLKSGYDHIHVLLTLCVTYNRLCINQLILASLTIITSKTYPQTDIHEIFKTHFV